MPNFYPTGSRYLRMMALEVKMRLDKYQGTLFTETVGLRIIVIVPVKAHQVRRDVGSMPLRCR